MNTTSRNEEVNTPDGVMNKILMLISVLAVILFTPFAVTNFIHGRTGLGLGTSLILLIFAANIWALKKSPKTSPYLLLYGLVPLFIIYLVFSIHIQKIIGVLWCYPAIIAFYYFLPEFKARTANIVIILFTFPVIWITFDIALVARIYVTLVLVSLLAAIFIKLINEQRKILQKSANTDFLTGVLNRTRLQNILEEAIEQNLRSHIPMALVALDLDHFKKVNDKYGHVQGDEVLKDIAALLKERCRKVDKIFRLGGEEFLILLYNTNLPNAINISEELRVAISKLNTLDSKVTVSLGIAVIKENETYLNWIKRADDKLYLAKDNGRNRIEY